MNMKRLMTMLALLLTIGSAGAKIIKKIYVSNAVNKSRLSYYITESERFSIDSLVIEGYFNMADFGYLNEMCCKGNLTGINLSNCGISNDQVSDAAFYPKDVNGASKLQYISLPTYVKYIGKMAFANTSLKQIVLPRSVEEVGEHAFDCCNDLKSVAVKSFVPPEVDGDLADGSVLKAAVLRVPSKVNYQYAAGWKGFANKEESAGLWLVKSVDLGGKPLAEVLGDDLYQPDSLIVSGGTLTEEDFACLRSAIAIGHLTGIDISQCDNTELPHSCFNGFAKKGVRQSIAGSITLPLYYVTLPNHLEEIGYSAFKHSGIRGLVLPETVKEIGQGVFATSTLRGDLVIPEGVHRLRLGSFERCTNLQSLHLPSTLDTVEENSLRMNMDGYVNTDIYVNRMTPPVLDIPKDEYCFGPFGTGGGEEYKKARLFVPVGAKAAFEADWDWQQFKNIIETPELTGVTASVKGVVDRSVLGGMTEVYTPSGRLVAKGDGLPVLPKGLYIVKTGGQTRKVVLGN